MKILLLTNSYPPQTGGLEQAVKNIAEELTFRGHAVVVFTDSQGASITVIRENFDIVVVRAPFGLPRIIRNAGKKIFLVSIWRSFLAPFTAPVSLMMLLKVLRRFRPDVVNLHYIGDSAVFCFLARKIHPFKLIVNVHGTDINRYNAKGALARKTIKHILHIADRVLSNSQALLDTAIAIEPDIRVKSSVAGNGVYLAKYSNRKEPDIEEGYILSLGNLRHGKGVDILLEAYHILQQQGEAPKLVIVGDGAERENLEKLSVTLDIHDSVIFVGGVSADEVPSWFKGATLFVLPSRQEAFGIVLLEAMASRKAIVASKTGGIPEIVQHDVSGILVKPESPTELAGAIKALLDDRQKRREMGEAGYRIVHERFTWPKVVDRYLEEYEKVLNN